jgi:hypothetical protein
MKSEIRAILVKQVADQAISRRTPGDDLNEDLFHAFKS